MHPYVVYLFHFSSALLALGLAYTCFHRSRAKATVGTVLTTVHPSRTERWLGAAGLAVLAVLVIVAGRRDLMQAALPALGLALSLQLVRPGLRDSVCGEQGVQVGWSSLALAELEEWRLTGDHLRFKLRGEWTAVDLPRAQHERMRARLQALVPERESRFHDRQEPPLLAARRPEAMPAPAEAAAPKPEVPDGGID